MPRHRSVFRNRDSLFPRHIPDSLPHREYHMGMLRDLFEDFLEKPGQTLICPNSKPEHDQVFSAVTVLLVLKGEEVILAK